MKCKIKENKSVLLCLIQLYLPPLVDLPQYWSRGPKTLDHCHGYNTLNYGTRSPVNISTLVWMKLHLIGWLWNQALVNKETWLH